MSLWTFKLGNSCLETTLKSWLCTENLLSLAWRPDIRMMLVWGIKNLPSPLRSWGSINISQELPCEWRKCVDICLWYVPLQKLFICPSFYHILGWKSSLSSVWPLKKVRKSIVLRKKKQREGRRKLGNWDPGSTWVSRCSSLCASDWSSSLSKFLWRDGKGKVSLLPPCGIAEQNT